MFVTAQRMRLQICGSILLGFLQSLKELLIQGQVLLVADPAAYGSQGA